MSRNLEIDQGPLLFEEAPNGEDEESWKIRVTQLQLQYRWTGREWECFSGELRGPFPPGHYMGKNAFRTRLLLMFESSTPAWVLALAALHRPPPVANA